MVQAEDLESNLIRELRVIVAGRVHQDLPDVKRIVLYHSDIFQARKLGLAIWNQFPNLSLYHLDDLTEFERIIAQRDLRNYVIDATYNYKLD